MSNREELGDGDTANSGLFACVIFAILCVYVFVFSSVRVFPAHKLLTSFRVLNPK